MKQKRSAAALGFGAAVVLGGGAAAYRLMMKFMSMTGKPEGVLGGLLLRSMDIGHGALADWGMAQLWSLAPKELFDVGCGGGRNAAVLLDKYPDAKLTAVDRSPLSAEKTRERNAGAVAAGRCAVLEGNVRKLPFEDGSFDLATAFETVYFWPGLTDCFTEIHRVLAAGGTFLIVNESDGADAAGKAWERRIDGMRCYTAEQLEGALRAAGFAEARTIHHASRPWIAVIAKKAGGEGKPTE